MADKSNHTSMFPDFHGLCSSTGPSHILGSTILGQILLRNPAFLVHNNSFQSSNVPSSSVVASKKHLHPREQNPGFYSIFRGTSQAIAALVSAPIERVYILMQCQNEMLKHGHLSSPYKGMKDCFQRTIKHEGFLSLWRGSSIQVVTPLALQALIFAYVPTMHDKKVQEPPTWLLPLSITLKELFLLPLEFARVRLATDVKATQGWQFSLDSSGKGFCNAVKNRMFNGVFDVYKKTLKSDGIVGLYRGYTLVACFEILNSHYRTNQQTKDARVAAVSLLINPLTMYPFLTVARRMMMTSGEATKYKGVIDACYQIVRHEGVSALYKGLTPFVIFCLSKDVVKLALLYFTYSEFDKLAKRV